MVMRNRRIKMMFKVIQVPQENCRQHVAAKSASLS